MRRDEYCSTRDTILKKLGFQPRRNKKFDKLHDLFEGVTMALIIAIPRFCFNENIFTSDFLNERLKAFDYGQVNESNKPSPNIAESDIKNEKATRLKQSPSASPCFAIHNNGQSGGFLHVYRCITTRRV